MLQYLPSAAEAQPPSRLYKVANQRVTGHQSSTAPHTYLVLLTRHNADPEPLLCYITMAYNNDRTQFSHAGIVKCHMQCLAYVKCVIEHGRGELTSDPASCDAMRAQEMGKWRERNMRTCDATQVMSRNFTPHALSTTPQSSSRRTFAYTHLHSSSTNLHTPKKRHYANQAQRQKDIKKKRTHGSTRQTSNAHVPLHKPASQRTPKLNLTTWPSPLTTCFFCPSFQPKLRCN
jgi:hypothetical protein